MMSTKHSKVIRSSISKMKKIYTNIMGKNVQNVDMDLFFFFFPLLSNYAAPISIFF
jgi:hypothetical protein